MKVMAGLYNPYSTNPRSSLQLLLFLVKIKWKLKSPSVFLEPRAVTAKKIKLNLD